MKALAKLWDAFSVALIVLNAIGGIVAGIWLAILGDWGAIGRGLLFAIGGGFVISLAMMPGMLLAGPAVVFYNKGSRLGLYVFGGLSAAYQFTVLSAWCLFIFFLFAHRADGSSAIPMMLWSYGVATGPIAYLAQKDLQSGNEYGGLAALFSQVAYVLALLVIFLVDPSRAVVAMTFGAVMAVGMGCHLAMAFAQDRTVGYVGRSE